MNGNTESSIALILVFKRRSEDALKNGAVIDLFEVIAFSNITPLSLKVTSLSWPFFIINSLSGSLSPL